MERTANNKSPEIIKLEPENAERYVEAFLDSIIPEDLVGSLEQRSNFTQTLATLKYSVQKQVSSLDASAMTRKLDEGVAVKHYEAVWQAIDQGNVTADLISTIRQTPVALSPIQKNIDQLRESALLAQRQARTADKTRQGTLRERAEEIAKVAASYGADTAVVKVGPKVISGEQYTLQKLHETSRKLAKGDDEHKDLNSMVRDAYGDYVLKDTSIIGTKVRVAVATIATAAVLSSIPNGVAHANETKISEIAPDDPKIGNGTKNAKEVATVLVEEVTSIVSTDNIPTKEQSVLPVKPKNPPKDSKTDNLNPDQEKSTTPKQDISSTNKDETMDGGLVFKLPTVSEKEKKTSNTISEGTFVENDTKEEEANVTTNEAEDAPRDIQLSDSETVKAKADNSQKSQDEVGPLKFVVPNNKNNTATITHSEQDDTEHSVKVDTVLDDAQLTFKIPREKKASIDQPPIDIKVIDEEDNELSFSLKKDKKNPGIKPIDLPEDLNIIPIPAAPLPAPEAAPVPPPAPEAPAPTGSDFSQAAQKLAERGDVWERRGIAMKFFIDEVGLTPSQAAGFVGNLLAETGADLNPGRNQNGGPAFGIAQWEGGRLMDLGAFAGKNQADFMTQLQFIKYELNGKELAAFKAIKTAENRKDAAIIVRKTYERPGIPHEDKRIAFADEVGDAFNKEYQAILASRLPAAPEAQPNGILAGWPTNGEAAMKLFNQCDPSWGEIKTPNGTRACDVSCGPTSVAMAVNALTGRAINPGEVINFTNTNRMWLPGDKGTSFDGVINLGKNFGINGYQMQNFKDINAYKEVLQNGGMILVAGSGPVPFVAAPAAHFVLIRGMTTDGKFLVADPYPKTPDTNDKPWDANQIINGTFGAVVFTK